MAVLHKEPLQRLHSALFSGALLANNPPAKHLWGIVHKQKLNATLQVSIVLGVEDKWTTLFLPCCRECNVEACFSSSTLILASFYIHTDINVQSIEEIVRPELFSCHWNFFRTSVRGLDIRLNTL